MRKQRKRSKYKKKTKAPRTLDSFLPGKEPEKPKPKPEHVYKSIKGTVQWYQEIYMVQGEISMIDALRQQFPNIYLSDFQDMVNYILFGTFKDGSLRNEPEPPSMDLLDKDYDYFKFKKKVYNEFNKHGFEYARTQMATLRPKKDVKALVEEVSG